MNWQEILTILIPLISLMGWIYSRIEKKADERYQGLKQEIDKNHGELKEEVKSLRNNVQSLDSRISRIEGQLMGPIHWEPKVVEKKEETKATGRLST